MIVGSGEKNHGVSLANENQRHFCCHCLAAAGLVLLAFPQHLLWNEPERLMGNNSNRQEAFWRGTKRYPGVEIPRSSLAQQPP